MAQRQRAWLITTRSQDRNLSPGLSSFRTGASALEQPYHRDGAEEARGAHNLEVVGSNPTPGIRQSLRDVKLAFRRCGAAGSARGS